MIDEPVDRVWRPTSRTMILIDRLWLLLSFFLKWTTEEGRNRFYHTVECRIMLFALVEMVKGWRWQLLRADWKVEPVSLGGRSFPRSPPIICVGALRAAACRLFTFTFIVFTKDSKSSFTASLKCGQTMFVKYSSSSVLMLFSLSSCYIIFIENLKPSLG